MRLGEARNPDPATHERDSTAGERIAHQRRVNEAGDSVTGSQDSITRQVRNLQRSETPATQTACGPDPAAFRGATVHGLMLDMFQKQVGNSSSKKALPSCANSTARHKPVTTVPSVQSLQKRYFHPRHCW